MEKIITIQETTFQHKSDYYGSYEGFVITTDKQIVKLGISSGQSCCEHFGYFMSEDNPKHFEGSELLSINITDTQLKTHSDFDPEDTYEGGVMFVNLHTSNGLLQFVAYNQHNGYYGHEAVVISEQLTISESL